MSAANVTFGRVDNLLAFPGQEQTFSFSCPSQRLNRGRCEHLLIAGRTNSPRDPQGKKGGTPQWDWDGDRAAPTFSPSINCGFCGWHGYIRQGRCVDQNGKDVL